MVIKVAVIGILVGLCSVHAESCGRCDNFTDIVFECRQNEGGMLVLSELSAWHYGDDTEITKKEFVEDIEAYCRNVTPKYKECISGSSVLQKCGNSEDIDQLTTDWMSIYCNGEGIADWLKEYVSQGFNFKHACALGEHNISFTCYFDQVFKTNQHNTGVYSIKEYNEWAKRVSTDRFDCTKDKIPQLNSL